ncbi:MAG TPA: hypothetical protein VMJ10_26220 [Kofleriaceae bacterium]|nr:hypothetical protein [Kofleriaceae bacterium]
MPTDQIMAQLHGSFDGQDVTVEFDLLSSSTDSPYMLEDGESLIATFQDQSAKMQYTPPLSPDATFAAYTASFVGVPAPNDAFAVAFRRASEGSALESSGTFPPGLVMGGVPATVSRSQSFTITWSPSGYSDELVVRGDESCIDLSIDAETAITGDTGSATFPAGSLDDVSDASSCTASITLSRFEDQAGVLDPAFADASDGHVDSTWSSTATFTSTP